MNPAVEDVLRTQHERGQRGYLSLWTIYDRPNDYPHGFIARRHDVGRGKSTPAADLLIADLEGLREVFQNAGLHCIPRQKDDDVKIVESWI
jgi:hypothetical protein